MSKEQRQLFDYNTNLDQPFNMDPFQHLPPELVHQVLKSFNFHELSVLHRVAPSWDGFLKSIEEVLLREKAVNELGKGKGNKVPCDMPDPEGKESGKGDHKSWKEICKPNPLMSFPFATRLITRAGSIRSMCPGDEAQQERMHRHLRLDSDSR